jgi:hypothetical protein
MRPELIIEGQIPCQPLLGIVNGLVGMEATGKVWDLLESGWRTMGDRPLPIGMETIVFLALRDGEQFYHLLI